MACLFARLRPSRSAPPSTSTFIPLSPDAEAVDPSSHLNMTQNGLFERVLRQATSDIVPDLESRWLRVDNYVDRPPHTSLTDHFENLDGFRRCHSTIYYHRPTLSTVLVGQVEFNSEADALSAARRTNGANSNGQLITVYPLQELDPDLEVIPGTTNTLVAMAEGEEQHVQGPARKKAKLAVPVKVVCKICTSDITGPHSKPCLRCREAWCLDCVKTWFVHATQDFERMPARCCNTVMHHGVAGNILSPVEFDLYKLRYDERTTQNPLYCPVATCSTFIPPRQIDPSHNTVTCPLCTIRICTKCKQLSATNHVCEEEAATAKIKALSYKTCPKCGTGVMKMYGCPHVRCACGAHFCWDCLRAINICYVSPCAAAREDGQYGEEADEDQSDSEEEVDIGGTIADTNNDTANAQPSPVANTLINRAGTPSPLQAVMNVFRGRRQRRANFEGRRSEVASLVTSRQPELEPSTSSGSDMAMAPEAESATSLFDLPNVAEVIYNGLTTPETAAQTAPLPAIIVHPPPNVAIEAPANNTNLPALNCNPLTDHQPAPTSVQSSPAGENWIDATDSVNLPQPPTPAAIPFPSEFPLPQSIGINLQELDIEPGTNPAVLPPTDTPISTAEAADPNLDDPNLLDWENEDYDFGEEPNDEAFDVWGCACNFTKLKKEAVDDHWMQDAKYLDCMKCFEEVVLQTSPQLYPMKNFKERLAWYCVKCGVVVCGKCERAKRKWLKVQMRQNGNGGERV